MNPNRYFDIKHRAMAIRCPLSSSVIELQHRNGTAFRYHDYIITTWNFYRSDPTRAFSFAIYQYDGDDRSETDPASLVYLMEDEYEDEGDAVRSAIERAVCIHAERLMKRTV